MGVKIDTEGQKTSILQFFPTGQKNEEASASTSYSPAYK